MPDLEDQNENAFKNLNAEDMGVNDEEFELKHKRSQTVGYSARELLTLRVVLALKIEEIKKVYL